MPSPGDAHLPVPLTVYTARLITEHFASTLCPTPFRLARFEARRSTLVSKCSLIPGATRSGACDLLGLPRLGGYLILVTM